FYTLIVLSTALFDKSAFKNVIVNGIVQAEDGQKMSKHLKNYPDPNLLIEKYGADSLRYYLLTSPVMKAENLNFSEKGVDEVLKRFVIILWNAYSFFVMNANLGEDKNSSATSTKASHGSMEPAGGKSDNLLDKWIVSELNILIKEVNKNMEDYDLVKASRPLREFIDKLSNWYIRRSRKRFSSEDAKDRNFAFQTLYYVLTEYSKLIAPFIPFLAEEMFKNLTGRESVHLEEYPKTNKNLIDKRINEKMNFVRDIVALGLAIRAKNRLKVRQPLQKLEVKIWKLMNRNSLFEGTAVKILKLEIKDELLDLIKDELNVKEVEFVDEIVKKNGWLYEEDDKIKIGLKIEITDELRTEGYMRELVRHIQTMRKETKYNRDDIIEVKYSLQKGSENLQKVFDSWTDYIKKECLAKSIMFSGKLVESDFDLVRNLKLDESNIGIGIKKQ
ncbi:MAG: class I tRNA ligase family protein, partial [Minisyncoccia bacterium]